MRPAARLHNEIAAIIGSYRVLLESSGSPLAATPERWQQCHTQAEAILCECAGRVDGRPPGMSAAVHRTVEIGALRAAEGIPRTESVRAALLLWQAAFPVFRETLPEGSSDHADGGPSPLVTALDALAQALIGRLLHEAVGYSDPGIIRGILANSDLTPPRGVASSGNPASKTAVLTIREHQVLTYVAEAITNYEIGRKLGIAETTVKRHLRNIFTKLGATSRMDAVRRAGMSVQPRQNPVTRKGHDDA